MIRRILLALALLATTPAHAAGEDRPGDYAERVIVTPAPGATLQRVSMPARLLVASRRADLADVRIFNAYGRPVPIARALTPLQQQRHRTTLPVLPILGAADALAVTGVSLRIDERNRASVVRVDGTPQGSGSEVLGVLLDTRRIGDPAVGLDLDVTTPTGQPVTFTVESSPDLKDWQPVADKVIYRNGAQTGAATIALSSQVLQGRYLRVTWQAASRLLSPVTVRAAQVVTTRGNADPLPRVVLTVPAPSDAHAIEFTLPFPATVAALEITLAGTDTLVPVRILGRDHAETPWSPIASGSLFRIGNRTNPPFALQGTRFRQLRIEADARSPGFTAAPLIAARLEPVQLAFLATGTAPFTLAAGKADAAPAYLALDDLLQANGANASAALPLATTAREADPTVQAIAPEHGTPWRRVVLWGVLLAATALLAGMVWLLMRRRSLP